jgi:hypothetical protein
LIHLDWKRKNILALSGFIHLYPALSSLIDQGAVKVVSRCQSRCGGQMLQRKDRQPRKESQRNKMLSSFCIGGQSLSAVGQNRIYSRFLQSVELSTKSEAGLATPMGINHSLLHVYKACPLADRREKIQTVTKSYEN